MSVLDRATLEESPLADLHAIASELSIDGYRRLRRAELIDAILGIQGGGDGRPATAQARSEGFVELDRAAVVQDAREPSPSDDDEASAADDEQPSARRRRGRRGGRGRGSAREDAPSAEAAPVESPPEDTGPGETAPAEESDAAETATRENEAAIEGVVELLPNGSGFLRVNPPEPSDDDVYISAAQVKRCELVSGDRVSGPRRTPRRSERFASLVRIDTINGRPASELGQGTRFDDLPAAFPDERFRLGSEDPTINAIEWLTPFGRGSRVTIVGGPRAGKTEALRRLAVALAAQEELQLSVALAGVRPEEIPEWGRGPIEPAAATSFAASADAQDHAVELVIDQARRVAARGAHAVVFLDGLDGIHPHAARKALAAARKIVDGGSLTLIATASEPVGGETTVIALDAALASTGRFPALDLAASGTIRPELLVGDAGAEAIARARVEALER
jgi:transcription termination factor Rho